MLCKLLRKLHPEWITGYHEHDSLLEHRFGEELTEEEQKKAWENYEAKKTETREYVARAELMSQLHQQQTSMLATGALSTTSTSGSNQPVAMPYMNQPQPPRSTEQGIEHVVQLAFQRCQELNTLQRSVKAIDIEVANPNKQIANGTLIEMRKKRTEYVNNVSKCFNFLQGSLNLLTVAISSYTAFPSYQAKLAAAKQFILDSMHNAASIKQ